MTNNTSKSKPWYGWGIFPMRRYRCIRPHDAYDHWYEAGEVVVASLGLGNVELVPRGFWVPARPGLAHTAEEAEAWGVPYHAYCAPDNVDDDMGEGDADAPDAATDASAGGEGAAGEEGTEATAPPTAPSEPLRPDTSTPEPADVLVQSSLQLDSDGRAGDSLLPASLSSDVEADTAPPADTPTEPMGLEAFKRWVESDEEGGWEDAREYARSHGVRSRSKAGLVEAWGEMLAARTTASGGA